MITYVMIAARLRGLTTKSTQTCRHYYDDVVMSDLSTIPVVSGQHEPPNLLSV